MQWARRHWTRRHGTRRLAVGAVVLVTSAGACQQDWDGPYPPPAELDATPFRSDAVTNGVAAVYLAGTLDGGAGERCHHLRRLVTDGTAESAVLCTDVPVAEVAGDEATWEDPAGVGDYAYLDGTLWLRIVSWDSLAEELVLHETVLTYCGTQANTASGAEWQLVDGDAPPDPAPCP